MSGTTGNTISLPFAERHAPQVFTDLVFQDPLVQQRLSLYANHHLHNSILLYGPYGTAKSTAALTIVNDRRRLYGCIGAYVHQYSGGQLGGSLTQALNSLNMMLSIDPDPCPYVVIDEVDQLTRAAQHQLRHLLSTTPDLRLILTTNEITRVDPGVQSRCDCIQLLPPTSGDWLPRVRDILAAEGVSLSTGGIHHLINGATDIRRILRTLEAFVVQSRLAAGQVSPVTPVQTAQVTASQPPVVAPTLTLVPGNALVTSSGSSSGNGPALTVLPQPLQTTPNTQAP